MSFLALIWGGGFEVNNPKVKSSQTGIKALSVLLYIESIDIEGLSDIMKYILSSTTFDFNLRIYIFIIDRYINNHMLELVSNTQTE